MKLKAEGKESYTKQIKQRTAAKMTRLQPCQTQKSASKSKMDRKQK